MTSCADLGPILHIQSMHSGKFIHVTRDHRQFMHQCNRRDLQIHWSDVTAPLLQIVADYSIPIRTTIIERKRNHLAQCRCDNFLPQTGIFIFFCTVHEFCAHGRARHQSVDRCFSEPGNQSKILPFENFDPDVAVEQVSHHHVFAGGSGNSGGRSNSKSAQQPIRSANSGIRSFNSSSVGSTLSASATEDRASRTCISSFSAASGFSRLNIRSSSTATALMENPSPFQLKISSRKS